MFSNVCCYCCCCCFFLWLAFRLPVNLYFKLNGIQLSVWNVFLIDALVRSKWLVPSQVGRTATRHRWPPLTTLLGIITIKIIDWRLLRYFSASVSSVTRLLPSKNRKRWLVTDWRWVNALYRDQFLSFSTWFLLAPYVARLSTVSCRPHSVFMTRPTIAFTLFWTFQFSINSIFEKKNSRNWSVY